MSDIGMRVLDFFYPNLCDCCKVKIPYGAWVCENCREELAKLECPPRAWEQSQHADTPFPWDGFLALYAYRDAAKRGILSLKQGHKGFLNAAADALAERIAAEYNTAEIDCITFVPVTVLRRSLQGYSHCELLADALGKRLSVRVEKHLLTERNGKIRQHQLSAEERKQYTDRFAHTGKNLADKTILLCDDIVTTGTTLAECTRLLKECGAKRVYTAVCCASIRTEKTEPTT